MFISVSCGLQHNNSFALHVAYFFSFGFDLEITFLYLLVKCSLYNMFNPYVMCRASFQNVISVKSN